jgi:N-acetylmuramoyl-L-alanine amidase
MAVARHSISLWQFLTPLSLFLVLTGCTTTTTTTTPESQLASLSSARIDSQDLALREKLHQSLASEEPQAIVTNLVPVVKLTNEIPEAHIQPPVTNLVHAVTTNRTMSPSLSLVLTNTWIPWESWSEATGLGKPKSLRTALTPTYVLQTTNGASKLTIGSHTASLNNSEFWLGFAPKLIKGQPHIHTLDVQKNFEPLLANAPSLRITQRIVVLDPGHGGEDPGAKSILSDRYEKEFTLDWARRLQRLLERQGWQVFMTRTNDTDRPLPERVSLAEEVHADLFISLHFNSASPNPNQAGLETYCLTPAGMPSNLTRNYPDNLREIFPNNAFDAQNIQLAAQLHRAILDVTKRPDRGIRRARFMGVLRGHHRPAVLIEGGYLSNPQEAKLIADPVYRQKLAQGVATALEKFLSPASGKLTKNDRQ